MISTEVFMSTTGSSLNLVMEVENRSNPALLKALIEWKTALCTASENGKSCMKRVKKTSAPKNSNTKVDSRVYFRILFRLTEFLNPRLSRTRVFEKNFVLLIVCSMNTTMTANPNPPTCISSINMFCPNNVRSLEMSIGQSPVTHTALVEMKRQSRALTSLCWLIGWRSSKKPNRIVSMKPIAMAAYTEIFLWPFFILCVLYQCRAICSTSPI